MLVGVFLDGLYILNLHKGGIIIFIVSALGLGWWGTSKSQLVDQRGVLSRLPLALSFGVLIVTQLSFVLILVGRIWNPIKSYGGLLIPIIGLLALVDWILKVSFVNMRSSLILFFVLLIAILLVRLAFVKGIILPPYDDSPRHYMIVQDLLASGNSNIEFYSIDTITNRYYHFGFHSLTAWMSNVSGMKVEDSIAILGQLFLVILPCSVFLFVFTATQDTTAGLVAMSLSAFAWRMPAFASNWGKYPAIAGLSLFPALIAIWILYWRMPDKRTLTTAILAILTTSLVLIHTRLVVCLIMVLISFLIVQKIPYTKNMQYWKTWLLSFLAILAFIPFGNYFMEFYENGYYLALFLVILLLPFAFYRNFRLSLSVVLFIVGVWGASRISIPFEKYNVAILDQPFIEILLCIPTSVLGGAGFAGLLNRFQLSALRWIANLTVALAIAFSFLSADSIYPDICCNYIKSSDIEAIEWLKKNTPQDAVVWITAFKSRNYMISTDAGAWIRALTGRNVNKLDFDFEWSSHNSFESICRPDYKEVYIYKGNGFYSFTDKILADKSWLKPVFASGETKIYKVVVPCTSTIP